jgi:hypothetical protein
MKMNGHIDHLVASFYIKSANDFSSSIKFGSYDPVGIAPNNVLQMYKTKDLSSWSIKIRNMYLNNDALIDAGGTRYLSLDMQLPYLYLPNADFIKFQVQMANFDRNIHCNYHNNYCKWYQSCDSLQTNTWAMTLEMFDDVHYNQWTLPSNNNFLISGSDFGDSINTCYVPVFRSINGYADTWYGGNIFLNYFYITYDMTPYTENSMDYIQVGIAPANPDNMIGACQYNNSIDCYAPQAGD